MWENLLVTMPCQQLVPENLVWYLSQKFLVTCNLYIKILCNICPEICWLCTWTILCNICPEICWLCIWPIWKICLIFVLKFAGYVLVTDRKWLTECDGRSVTDGTWQTNRDGRNVTDRWTREQERYWDGCAQLQQITFFRNKYNLRPNKVYSTCFECTLLHWNGCL